MEKIQFRRDTAANWAKYNPILAEGELGIELDTKKRKVGDGVTAWNNLEYLAAENIVQGIGDSENAVMSQKAVTSIIGLDNYEEFSTSESYSAGDVVNYNGKLYQFTSNHPKGAWTGMDVKPTSAIEQLGYYLTVDKLRVQSYNLPKDVKYLKSPDGKYWELYVNESHQLQIREIDPDIITELPSNFPVYNVEGDFSEYFDTWTSVSNPFLIVRNKNGVIAYNQLNDGADTFAEFRKEKNSSEETRYITAFPNGYTGLKGEQLLTIYDKDFNVIDTNIGEGFGQNSHDFVYFDDNHVAILAVDDKRNVSVPNGTNGNLTVNVESASIVELKKDGGIWKQVGIFRFSDYPQLCTDEFGSYVQGEVLEIHANTLFSDYDGNYVMNLRNNDSFIKIKRIENSDGTVTIGSKTLDYDEAIIGRVGGKYNSGYVDNKRVLEDGFAFTDVPNTLQDRSTDAQPDWKWYHAHDVAYWGMKNIGGQNYPTYTLFDNNMWTDNQPTVNYVDVNPRNNYSNNPQGNGDNCFIASKSDSGGTYDTNMVSRIVQLSIDWENHLIKDYRVYIVPKHYSYTRSSAQMWDEGVILISFADQKTYGLYDFNDEQTENTGNTYKNGKELFKVTTKGVGSYRIHGYNEN